MVDYYYSDGKETFGPYSIDQLKEKKLSPETLVWHERLAEWAMLKDLPEVITYHSMKSEPPPLPVSSERQKGTKPELDPSKVVHGRAVYLRDEEIIISRTVVKWLMIWTFFHIFALFASYKEIPFFNNYGEPRTNQFWPVVNYFDEYYVTDADVPQQVPETQLKFNGIFINYDWTEFGCYVGGLLLLVVFYYLYKKAD